ncbi:MAG TPA: bifunctional diaminohydroxyphosphoribosylaminopyrimidine deaminase/5-amino-6-(5-phosphoribosylamino)uracil reductase RibD [Solirubrobacterales bacterium]|nr:bifunctional diaminohydroxyphosphoribosylaminopyrimidine deaminase/5-amino-6-(5-phosphoribosylamino)uracil reductase RibD [Solirubrobacterales bacterium]
MPTDQPAPLPEYWDRALHLAERGHGHVSPNPLVGAVILKDGESIGEGWHKKRGDLHAERVALADAAERGNDVTGATMLVTLEPCAHTGSQPPCADAIIEAGISRVVIAAADPTEKTAGIGPRRLAEAGIEVEWAAPEVAARAIRITQPFRKYAATGRPLLTLKMATTLDGKIATHTGDSRWISGEESRALVHRWRAEMDAVAVGSGTFRADDPKLTARLDGEIRQPRRVVFDSGPVMTPDAAIFEDIEHAPVTVVVNSASDSHRVNALADAGVMILRTEGEDQPAHFVNALDQLGDIEVTSMLLEGGPTLAGTAIASGEVDRIELFVAPVVLGGGLSAVEGHGPDLMADAIKVPEMLVERVGQDVLMSANLREW